MYRRMQGLSPSVFGGKYPSEETEEGWLLQIMQIEEHGWMLHWTLKDKQLWGCEVSRLSINLQEKSSVRMWWVWREGNQATRLWTQDPDRHVLWNGNKKRRENGSSITDEPMYTCSKDNKCCTSLHTDIHFSPMCFTAAAIKMVSWVWGAALLLTVSGGIYVPCVMVSYSIYG